MTVICAQFGYSAERKQCAVVLEHSPISGKKLSRMVECI